MLIYIVCDEKNVIKNKLEILEDTCLTLIDSGVTLGHYKTSYILKKLVILSIKEGSKIDHLLFNEQREKIIDNYKNYLRTKKKPKFKNKDSLYWQNTFGINEDELEFYEKLIK